MPFGLLGPGIRNYHQMALVDVTKLAIEDSHWDNKTNPG
jgi:hypothetical protein